MAARQVPGPTRTAEEPRAEDETRLWKFINGVFSQLKQDCPIFGILVIGETGTGKSTLINNLLGHEVAVVGDSMESETQLVTAHELSVEGVSVVVYDTPGLDDTREDDDEKHLDIMKSLIARKKIHLVIYCMKLTETRMRRSLIHTFKEYHKIGVPWEQTVVTITFADMIEDTTGRFSKVQQHLKKTLIEKVGVTSSVVDRLKICPTAKDPTEALPSGRQWYVPFWLDVVEVLVPAALAQFLYIHKSNIHMEGTAASRLPNPVNITLVGEDQERFRREVDRLPYQPVAATALPDAVTDGPSATTPPTETAAEEVLDHFRDRFIKDTASSDIMYELKHKDVIASGDVEMIERKADVTQRNQYLHECLKRKCTKEALMEVCNVMTAVRGHPKLNALGEDMRRRLKGSETPSSAHPPIGIRQTASNSKKARTTSTATQFSVSEFLKKYETEFFEIVNPGLSLLRLVRKGVITVDIRSDINTSNTDDAREVLYHHLAHHANVDTLKEYLRVAIAADGYPRMQSLGRKMMEELEQGGEQTH